LCDFFIYYFFICFGFKSTSEDMGKRDKDKKKQQNKAAEPAKDESTEKGITALKSLGFEDEVEARMKITDRAATGQLTSQYKSRDIKILFQYFSSRTRACFRYQVGAKLGKTIRTHWFERFRKINTLKVFG